MAKSYLAITFILLFGLLLEGLIGLNFIKPLDLLNPSSSPQPSSYPDLNVYQISKLRSFHPQTRLLVEETDLSTNQAYQTHTFTLITAPNPNQPQDLKKISGLINIPNQDGPYPTAILIRGYVDQQEYLPGTGSKRIGEYLAENGFLTLALDYLGYGSSDSESGNIFETQFQTYTSTIALLESITQIPQANPNEIVLWGHSNGGQIALSLLAITQRPLPTVLWAPVTQPFPYNILYFSIEAEDKGLFLRRELAEFEAHHDSRNFSFSNYLTEITSPLFLLQSFKDEAVPVSWSQNFCRQADEEGINIQCRYFAAADHNLNPDWNQAAYLTLDFYQKNLKN